jgi:AbrB family looped-hinge helix DNA binding protein
MAEIRTQFAEGGCIVIPAEFRQALGLHVGDEVILRLEDGTLRIYTPSQAIRYAQELLRPYLPQGRSLSDELIAERRKEE